MASSDGHGFENPHGFAGTGHAGTGAGDQIVTRDIPVPVWVGDGYVTGRNTGVTAATPPPISTTRLSWRRDFDERLIYMDQGV